MKEEYPSISGIKKYLHPKFQNIDMHLFECIDSTNTRAKRGGYPIGSVLLSKEQSGGRGRLGKSFFSPANSGIYLSAVLKPWESDIEQITVAAGFSIIKAIEKATGIKTERRRINDIYFNDRKICGILAEGITNIETGLIEAIVIGVGLNVFPPLEGFPKELEGIATALYPYYNSSVNKNKIAAELINALLFLT